MINIKKIAKESLALHAIVGTREKINTHDIVGKDLTINAFGFTEVNGSRFALIVFAELPDYYYCAGLILTKMCDSISAAVAGDPAFYDDESGIYNIEQTSDKIVIRLTEERTSDGTRNLTKVTIVD